MKRLAVGIALAFLPNCIQGNPVAEEQKSAEQQLRDSIGPFCDETCQLGTACNTDVTDDCAGGCRDFMAVFVDHGDQCVALGHQIESCLKALPECERLGADNACAQPAQDAHEQCKTSSDSKPPPAIPRVTCDDGGGTSSGKAPSATGPAETLSCDTYYEGCSDGATYRLSCHQNEGTLVCNCFRDGVVNGVAFTPADGNCPSEYSEINGPCSWNLQY